MVEVENAKFGGVLRKLREKRGFSLRDLATKSGIFHSNLANMEAGRVRVGPKVFVRLSRAVVESESDELEMALAFAASRIGKTSSETGQVRADILLMLPRVFRDAGINLHKLQNLEVVEFPRLFENAFPTRVWFAYEKGAKPPADHKRKVVDSLLKDKTRGGLLLAIVRRNGRAALVQISEMSLSPQ
jgi:transcriptional regulator with XRE-family HTH domain